MFSQGILELFQWNLIRERDHPANKDIQYYRKIGRMKEVLKGDYSREKSALRV